MFKISVPEKQVTNLLSGISMTASLTYMATGLVASNRTP